MTHHDAPWFSILLRFHFHFWLNCVLFQFIQVRVWSVMDIMQTIITINCVKLCKESARCLARRIFCCYPAFCVSMKVAVWRPLYLFAHPSAARQQFWPTGIQHFLLLVVPLLLLLLIAGGYTYNFLQSFSMISCIKLLCYYLSGALSTRKHSCTCIMHYLNSSIYILYRMILFFTAVLLSLLFLPSLIIHFILLSLHCLLFHFQLQYIKRRIETISQMDR